MTWTELLMTLAVTCRQISQSEAITMPSETYILNGVTWGFPEYDSKLIGARLKSDANGHFSGRSIAFCLRFVTNFLQRNDKDGAQNRILSMVPSKTRKEQHHDLIGFKASLPSSFAWFGSPRRETSFR